LPVIAISVGPDPSTLDPALLEDAWRRAGTNPGSSGSQLQCQWIRRPPSPPVATVV